MQQNEAPFVQFQQTPLKIHPDIYMLPQTQIFIFHALKYIIRNKSWLIFYSGRCWQATEDRGEWVWSCLGEVQGPTGVSVQSVATKITWPNNPVQLQRWMTVRYHIKFEIKMENV